MMAMMRNPTDIRIAISVAVEGPLVDVSDDGDDNGELIMSEVSRAQGHIVKALKLWDLNLILHGPCSMYLDLAFHVLCSCMIVQTLCHRHMSHVTCGNRYNLCCEESGRALECQ
jgi:hypothetical protein